MKIENMEVTLNRSNVLLIGEGDEVNACIFKVYNCEVGIQHPIEVEGYGVLRDCIIYSGLDEPILLHAHARCIGNVILPMR